MLKQFSNEKKSPVGYKAFAQACITHKQPSGAVEAYIDRITALEDKFDLYVEVGWVGGWMGWEREGEGTTDSSMHSFNLP